jgi:AI-2 transport protein TqsA
LLFLSSGARLEQVTDEETGGQGIQQAGVSGSTGPLLVIATMLVLGALAWGQVVFAPAAFAIFIVMVVRPLQTALATFMPKSLAVVITLGLSLVCVGGLLLVFAWGMSSIGQWLIRNAARFQELYQLAAAWLESHGIAVISEFSEIFNFSWLVRIVQVMLSRINGLAGFAALVFAFVVLGLLEAEHLVGRVTAAGGKFGAVDVVALGRETSGHFGKYMMVRTGASAITAAAVWFFAYVVGLELPAAWAAIAFTLNYIPILGPLVATLLPSLFALAQFESLQVALVVLAGLTVVQFVIGSYLEPTFTGSALSISPFAVTLVILLWSLLWGLSGAFIGVPILVAVLALCRRIPELRWLGVLLAGGKGSGRS